MQPAYVDGEMVLSTQIVIVNFGTGGDNFFGGQVTLTREDDGISLTSTEQEIKDLAIAKAKDLIANSKVS